MSMVDSNQSLNNILDKLGIQPQEQQKRANGGALGQEDFLKLMTTQLQIRTLLHRWKMQTSLRRWLSFQL